MVTPGTIIKMCGVCFEITVFVIALPCPQNKNNNNDARGGGGWQRVVTPTMRSFLHRTDLSRSSLQLLPSSRFFKSAGGGLLVMYQASDTHVWLNKCKADRSKQRLFVQDKI